MVSSILRQTPLPLRVTMVRVLLLNGRGEVETEVDVVERPREEVSLFLAPFCNLLYLIATFEGRGDRGERSSYPPYIHFTLQKTNRDTQDALAHLSRSLHCNVKDLSVAGTKDKRGVTVQRVSLKRGNKTVEDVWKLANGVGARRTAEEAVTRRGERGIRIADFNYRKASLELGMLKGNGFLITLR